VLIVRAAEEPDAIYGVQVRLRETVDVIEFQ